MMRIRACWCDGTMVIRAKDGDAKRVVDLLLQIHKAFPNVTVRAFLLDHIYPPPGACHSGDDLIARRNQALDIQSLTCLLPRSSCSRPSASPSTKWTPGALWRSFVGRTRTCCCRAHVSAFGLRLQRRRCSRFLMSFCALNIMRIAAVLMVLKISELALLVCYRQAVIPFMGCMGKADAQIRNPAGPKDLVISRDDYFLINGCHMAWLLPRCESARQLYS